MNVRLAILTGMSCSGKTTAANVVSQSHVPVLHSDADIFKPIGRILRDPKLHTRVNATERWIYLREHWNFDHLFALHHRDWFLRSNCPASFLVEGWIYCDPGWRQLLISSFDPVTTVSLTVGLFVLDPPLQELRRRCLKRRKGKKQITPDVLNKQVAWRNKVWQKQFNPDGPGTMKARVESDDDALVWAIRQFLQPLQATDETADR